jgi:hypothetical protein
VITPDSPDRVYSTRLRTALVLTGSGTSAAYHAGVLRALQEAGVKIDLTAGRGVGVIGALFAAVDGGARLWDPDGIWKGPGASHFYPPRPGLRVAAWALAGAGAVLAVPIFFLALAVLLAIVGLLLTLVGLGAAATVVTSGYARWIEIIFAPTAMPTVVPRLALFAALIALAALCASAIPAALTGSRRRSAGGLAGRILGGPLATAGVSSRCTSELWRLVRGGAQAPLPSRVELGRRYLELLSDNLGQPGFRELVLTAHDLDARRDVVFALLHPRLRTRFFSRVSVAAGARQAEASLGGRPGLELVDAGSRPLEAFDLAGPARDHLLDVMDAALAIPLASDPHLLSFSPEGPWRGETHRLGDRPGSLQRLIEEVAAAGAEQVILVSASPPPAHAHELSGSRGDLRGRAAEQLDAFESATLRDALEQFTGRFAGLFVIRPAHNPLGALDFEGVYDERSDRTHSLGELLDRGYEDAYRQFIEPVVGASGDTIATVQP